VRTDQAFQFRFNEVGSLIDKRRQVVGCSSKAFRLGVHLGKLLDFENCAQSLPLVVASGSPTRDSST
jgi:hypothetical protein